MVSSGKIAFATFVPEQLITHFCRRLPKAEVQSNMEYATRPTKRYPPIISIDHILNYTRSTFSAGSQTALRQIGLKGNSFGHNDEPVGRSRSGYYSRPQRLAITLYISLLVLKTYIIVNL